MADQSIDDSRYVSRYIFMSIFQNMHLAGIHFLVKTLQFVRPEYEVYINQSGCGLHFD